jgi:hypothetical protein
MEGNESIRFEGSLHGVCHRCGWSSEVRKLDRHDRRILGTGRKYSRVCEECFDTLVHGTVARPAGEQVSSPATLKAVRDRNVA